MAIGGRLTHAPGQLYGVSQGDEHQLASVQEQAVLQERQRLARDLHDSVTQALYGITLHAQAAQRLLIAGESAGAASSLRILQDTAQEALDEMRLLIFDLRPPLLEQVGLVAALEARLKTVEGRAQLQTHLITSELGILPPAIEHAIYCIAQEAINNTLKHACAQNVAVLLRWARDQISLKISDDGVGCDMAEARRGGGVGLCGIIERAEELGGVCRISSDLGIGTCIEVEIPL